MAQTRSAGAKTTGNKATGKMKRKAYEKELRKLQVELCHLQDWVKANGERVIIVFEGRDAAGKGGTIKAITERVSPRVFRVVALPAPSDREKSQMYMQRYIAAFPGRRRDRDLRPQLVQPRRRRIRHGLLHRASSTSASSSSARIVEKYHRRRRHQPDQDLAGGRPGGAGAALRGPHRRSAAAVEAEPDGLESFRRWYDYLAGARHDARAAPTATHAPWYIVRSDDKKRARLNCISHILTQIPYKRCRRDKVKLPKRSDKGKYDDQASLKGGKFVAQRFPRRRRSYSAAAAAPARQCPHRPAPGRPVEPSAVRTA